MVFAIKH